MGLTVLDAGVIIGFLDDNDVHHETAHTALVAARDRNDRLVATSVRLCRGAGGPVPQR